MTSKQISNNINLRQKRESSVGNSITRRFGPKIIQNGKVQLVKQAENMKQTAHRKCGSIEQSTAETLKNHSRQPSNGESECSTRPSSSTSLQFLLTPQEKMNFNLISDYGKEIDRYLRGLEDKSQISSNHLDCHKINGIYRAKMVDWIVEVLTAFKCEDQTFFLAINIMDRYFDACNKNKNSLQLHELHITGIACMFMASKYQDIYPLLMKTVFNKIGHQKISIESIRQKEMEILRTIGFQVGGAPTPYEFLQSYMEQALANHKEKDFIYMMSIYLGKMSLHHELLCTKESSLLGASSIYVALKICEQMRQTTIISKALLQSILDVSSVEESELVDCSKKLLYLAQNFEKELPGLANLKGIYLPLLNKFVSQ